MIIGYLLLSGLWIMSVLAGYFGLGRYVRLKAGRATILIILSQGVLVLIGVLLSYIGYLNANREPDPMVLIFPPLCLISVWIAAYFRAWKTPRQP